MNKIVREHYPVERLPEDLRAELGIASTVRLIIETDVPDEHERQRKHEVALAALQRARAAVRDRGVTAEEAVARVRTLRDEWEH